LAWILSARYVVPISNGTNRSGRSSVSGMSTPRGGPLDFLSENDCGVCHRVTAIGIGMMPMLNTYYASLAGAPGMNRIGSQ